MLMLGLCTCTHLLYIAADIAKAQRSKGDPNANMLFCGQLKAWIHPPSARNSAAQTNIREFSCASFA